MSGMKLCLWRIMRVAAAALLLLTFPSQAASTRPPAAQADDHSVTRYKGEVYLLRGFADVFSGGLDQLGADLVRAGIPAKVVNHRTWKTVGETIVANQKKFGAKPVILIGHSLGANSAILIAQQLKKAGVTVTYLVTLAATAPPPVPSNVRRVENYYFKSGGWGQIVRASPDFGGVLENLDYSGKAEIGHFNLDDQATIQKTLLRAVRTRFKS
jgi:pimeloyl-ACP methyl ester carboxylesterase